MLKVNKSKADSLRLECLDIAIRKHRQSHVESLYFDALLEGVYFPKDVLYEPIYDGPCSTEEEAYALMLVIAWFKDEGFPPDDIYTLIADSISAIDSNKFKNNPYLNDVKLGEFKIKSEDSKFIKMPVLDYELQQVRITSNSYSPYEVNPIKPFGFSPEGFDYPLLVLDDKLAFGPSSFVINLSQEHIDKAHGKVLTFGLELGYFTYLTALKDDVESVTVIESNKRLINLFNKYILPKFNEKAKTKINIIHGDYDETFLNKDFMNMHDYCFINIYRNTNEGMPYYINYKENEPDLTCEVSYWLEDDFITIYQDQVFLRVLDALFMPYEDEVTNKISDISLKIDLYFESNDYTIKNKMDFYSLLFDKSIMNEILAIPLVQSYKA